MEASPLYRSRAADIRRVLDAVVRLEHAPARRRSGSAAAPLRAVAWNIERGVHVDEIIDRLGTHADLRDADVLLLTELDVGMARSGNRDIPGDIARRLELNGVFAPCYINLERGSGTERDAVGDNRQAVHGNALFSPWPIRDPRSLRLANGKDKMAGREKRIGSQAAVLATVETPVGPLRCASVHLDAHSSRAHRRRQLRSVLDVIDAGPGSAAPALVGGDFNTSTHNTQRAAWAIIGFWVRVAMGVERVLRRHYPYPDRLFERGLFRLLERRGFDYRQLNEPGATTLDHCILSHKDRRNLEDWLPSWCLAHVERELAPFNNVASLKLDWFAGRGIRPVCRTPGVAAARVVRGIRGSDGRLSDHDPIVLEFLPSSA